MKIGALMTSDVYSAREDDKIGEIAENMKKYDIGFVPVCDTNGRVTGIITDRDIVLRWAAECGGDPETVAAQIMSEDVKSVSPEHSTTEAARLMARAKVRRLPVTEQGLLKGVVSLGDLSRSNTMFSETAAALCDICEDQPQSS